MDESGAEMRMEHTGHLSSRRTDNFKVTVSETNLNNDVEETKKFTRNPKADCDAPDFSPSAYLLFFNEMCLQINPSIHIHEITRLVGDAWRNLSLSDRESYETQATIAKQNHNFDLAEYQMRVDCGGLSEYLAESDGKQKISRHDGQSSIKSPTAHQGWRDAQWYSDIPMLEGKLESFEVNEDTPSIFQKSGIAWDHLPLKSEALDDSDLDMLGYNRFTPPSSTVGRPARRLYSRPPMMRSYVSSSGSSASTLMTPRDAVSWVGSTYSPSLIENVEPVPNHFASRLAKDMLFGDFPTNPEFRFSSLPASNSPDSPDPEWLLEDYAAHGQLPIYPSHQDTELRRPEWCQEICRNRDLKRVTKSARSAHIPGLGIISKDGTYKKGTNLRSKSRSRHGPLTPEQAQHAALMRQHGACKQCRKRKVKCTVLHRAASNSKSPSTPPPPDKTLAFPSVVLTLIAIQRSMERRYAKQLILPDITNLPILEQISRQASYFENMTLQGLDLQSLFVRPNGTADSSDANSINSFDDDLTEYSYDDSVAYFAGQVQYAGSEDFLAAIQPSLNRLPSEVASSLGNELLSLFGIWLGTHAPYQHAPYDGTASSSNSQNPHGNTLTPTNSTGSGQKRPSDDGSGYSNPSGNNGDENRKWPRNISQTSSGSGSMKRWACPYYQKDPYSHCVEGDFGDYRKCAKSPGFSEVHRVKQHLYDCHAAIYCTRCYSQFKTKDDLVSHCRSTLSCGIQDPQPLQGLDEDQRRSLKPRDRTKSEEERWKTVYKICFPLDEAIPSPYYVHYTRETARLRSQVFQIVDEETMFVDRTIRERLIVRLQNAFDSDAQNSQPNQSSLWSSRGVDFSTSDGTYMPMTAPPVSNPPPWSEYETRHTNLEDNGYVENRVRQSLVTDYDDKQYAGPSLESEFFIPDDFEL